MMLSKDFACIFYLAKKISHRKTKESKQGGQWVKIDVNTFDASFFVGEKNQISNLIKWIIDGMVYK